MSAQALRSRFLDVIVELVRRSRVPMFIIELESLQIEVESAGAQELFGDTAGSLGGLDLTSLFAEGTSAGHRLLLNGDVSGYETRMQFTPDGPIRRMWVRSLPERDGGLHALVVLTEDRAPVRGSLDFGPDDDDAIFASADAGLTIDHVAEEERQPLGYRSDALIGRSLLTIIDPQHVVNVLAAIARTARTGEPLTVRTVVLPADRLPVAAQLVLVPSRPSPSIAMALFFGSLGDRAPDGWVVAETMVRLARKSHTAHIQAQLTNSLKSRLSIEYHLTGRELEISERIVLGDRVPAIAQQLFVTPSTVRNHLSSAFGKLGVKSQQEMIAMLMPAFSTVNGVSRS